MNWQPIETAPKDGTTVLVYPPLWDGRTCSIAIYNEDKYNRNPRPFWDRDDGMGKVTRSRETPPTHWMPLPAAPEEECRTCSGHGAVGNVLTTEPCPDCTPAAVAPACWTDDQVIRFACGVLIGGNTADSIELRLEQFRRHEGLRGIPAPIAASTAKESP